MPSAEESKERRSNVTSPSTPRSGSASQKDLSKIKKPVLQQSLSVSSAEKSSTGSPKKASMAARVGKAIRDSFRIPRRPSKLGQRKMSKDQRQQMDLGGSQVRKRSKSLGMELAQDSVEGEIQSDFVSAVVQSDSGPYYAVKDLTLTATSTVSGSVGVDSGDASGKRAVFSLMNLTFFEEKIQ